MLIKNSRGSEFAGPTSLHISCHIIIEISFFFNTFCDLQLFLTCGVGFS